MNYSNTVLEMLEVLEGLEFQDWACLDGLDVFLDVFDLNLDISRNINGSKVDLNLQGIVYLFA